MEERTPRWLADRPRSWQDDISATNKTKSYSRATGDNRRLIRHQSLAIDIRQALGRFSTSNGKLNSFEASTVSPKTCNGCLSSCSGCSFDVLYSWIEFFFFGFPFFLSLPPVPIRRSSRLLLVWPQKANLLAFQAD